MNKFSTENFTQVCQFIVCRSFEEFLAMYKEIGLQIGESTTYSEEKWNIAKSDFPGWWCNLDSNNQEKILNYVNKFYNK